MTAIDDVLFLIRTVGERTTEPLVDSLHKMGVNEDAIEIVREAPFTEALKKSCDIALKRNFRYCLMFDADFLPRSSFLELLSQAKIQMNPHVFRYQFSALDKFTGRLRCIGPKLYRTSDLGQLRDNIPDEHSLRPETDAMLELIKLKKIAIMGHQLSGVHDYEQDTFTIYRTCFIYAKKRLHDSSKILELIHKYKETDYDFVVAGKGFLDGLFSDDLVTVNADDAGLIHKYKSHKFVEKEPPNIKTNFLQIVDKIIQEKSTNVITLNDLYAFGDCNKLVDLRYYYQILPIYKFIFLQLSIFLERLSMFIRRKLRIYGQ
ncbi:hypothetical protein N9R39_01005 [Amylibacter sp.]|nr:hypothetical protein [Amylibacter sp.]